MWRPRRDNKTWLRIGRHAVERWNDAGDKLSLERSVPLPHGVPHAPALIEAIKQACAPGPFEQVGVIVESAWLPLVWVESNQPLLLAAHADSLVRHRFALSYDESHDPVASWDLRVDHRAGDTQAIGYGLPARVRQAVADAANTLSIRWSLLTPAFAWGLDRLTARHRRFTGWWLWPEQDRWLIARFTRGHLTSLRPESAAATQEDALALLVRCEQARLGLVARTDRIAAATWQPVDSSSRMLVEWLPLAAEAVRAVDGRVLIGKAA